MKPLYGGLPKRLKAMVAYLKASLHEKTYSNYLWLQEKWKRKNLCSYPKTHRVR